MAENKPATQAKTAITGVVSLAHVDKQVACVIEAYDAP